MIDAPPAPAGPMRLELADLENGELLGIVRSLPLGSDQSEAACEVLVRRHRYLVRSEVRRYLHSPEPTEDLMQVGYVGLVKAVRHFDPDLGGSLSAFARPCISGELKRHFRDKRWPIHVKRSVQDLVVQVRAVSGQLAQELGRMPGESDLATYLGVSGGEVREARGAERAFQPGSLDAPNGSESGTGTLADLLGDEDPRIEHMLGMHAVAAHWRELPPREQEILIMYFYEDMTQAQIGRQLGLSQMHVSRLIARALGYLRPRLLGYHESLDGPAAGASTPLLGKTPSRRGVLAALPAGTAVPSVVSTDTDHHGRFR